MSNGLDSREQVEYRRKLEELLQLPVNKYCADCGSKGPRWASTNIGVFLCLRCSGIHRAMGTHISKVKSVNLDKWQPEMIQRMIDVGNEVARSMYEARVPASFRRPNGDQFQLEQWIRRKYERREFYSDEPVVNGSHSASGGRTTATASAGGGSLRVHSAPPSPAVTSHGARQPQPHSHSHSQLPATATASAGQPRTGDLLSLFDPAQQPQPSHPTAATAAGVAISAPPTPTPSSSGNVDPTDLFLFGSGGSAATPVGDGPTVGGGAAMPNVSDKPKLSTQGILSLYSTGSGVATPVGYAQQPMLPQPWGYSPQFSPAPLPMSNQPQPQVGNWNIQGGNVAVGATPTFVQSPPTPTAPFHHLQYPAQQQPQQIPPFHNPNMGGNYLAVGNTQQGFSSLYRSQ